MAAAPGALLSAVTDNRINEFVFKAVLHVLVYTYMELAAIVIERPGTELVYVTVVILQDLFHGPGVTGAGRLDHCKGQRLLISGLLHSAIPPVSLVLMVSSVLVLCRWTALRDIPTTAPISPSVSSRTQCGIKMLCPRLGQAGKGSGHQPVADLKLTAIGRKYKTVAGVLIYRA